jgi:glycosyltransferase involved in cell wall biosynthesis
MNKRLLLINNGYPTEKFPNYTTYIKTINECLVKAGYGVDLLILKLIGIGAVSKFIQYLSFFIRLLHKSLFQYDIIYINHAPFTLPIFFRPSLYKKRIIIHWHGSELVSKTKYINFAILFLKSRVQSMVHIVPSLYFKGELIRIMDIDDHSIIVSPSGGIDDTLFVPTGEKKEKEFVIGFASALSRPKGVDLLLDIMKRKDYIQNIIKREVTFHVINYGSERDGFIKECNSEKLPVQIYQKMAKDKMVLYYNSLDVLLMPSIRKGESLGLVALEAMFCNVPVIAYNICAFPEFVVPGKTGMLIALSGNKNKNIESFINTIISLFHTASDLSPREVVFENYSSKKVVEQYKNLLW